VAERLKTDIPCGGPQTTKKNDGTTGAEKISASRVGPHMYRARVPYIGKIDAKLFSKKMRFCIIHDIFI